MEFYVLIGIALGLAMDAFSVAVGASIRLRNISKRQVFRFGWHFGLFQAVMPVIGYAAGRSIETWIRAWDHWIAFGLLVGIGGKAVYESLHSDDGTEAVIKDPTRGWSLVLLSTATSIDALAVGLSFAVLQVQIWTAALVIGIITGILTTLGMLFGARLGARFGDRLEMLGGVILIGIGVKILIEHSLG